MVNDNTITLSRPNSEFNLPLNVSLVSPKSEMLLLASKPRIAVSMVLSEDKTEIIEIEEILYDDFDEEREISIIKQEKDCSITNVTCEPPNDHPTSQLEFGVTQELVVNLVRANLEKLSKDTKSRKRKRSTKLQNAALSKQLTIKSEASNDVEIDINNDVNGDWIIKNEEVHIKFEGDEDDHQESSSTSPSRGDEQDEKSPQPQQRKKGIVRSSKKVSKRGKRIHHCPQCGYETSIMSHFKRHMNVVHKNGEGLEKYSCSKCTFQTFYMQQLTHHMRRHDGVKVKYHRCARCGYITCRKSGLTEHVCDELEVLTCYDCGYQTLIKNNLRRHVSCHSPTKYSAFNCNVCSFGTKSQYLLKLHMVRHNTKLEDFKQYKCTECDYQSRQKGQLKNHSLVHRSDKDVPRYACYHCDFRTHLKMSLKRHIFRHDNPDYKAAKTIECSECDFKTAYKSSLILHLLQHKKRAEIPMLKCDRCDYRTIQKSNLNTHRRTHNPK